MQRGRHCERDWLLLFVITAAASLIARVIPGQALFTLLLAALGVHSSFGKGLPTSANSTIAKQVSSSVPTTCKDQHVMLVIMVDLSKCGPWCKYFVQVLVKDAMWTPLLPGLLVAVCDYCRCQPHCKHYTRPSFFFTSMLADLGVYSSCCKG